MSQHKYLASAVLFCTATIIGILSLPLPIYALFGAASLMQSIFFLVAMDNKAIAYLILSYLSVIFLLLIVSCIFAYRKKKAPFVFIMCVDLVVSILFCLYNVLFGRVITPYLVYDFAGIVPRALFCIYVFTNTHEFLHSA